MASLHPTMTQAAPPYQQTLSLMAAPSLVMFQQPLELPAHIHAAKADLPDLIPIQCASRTAPGIHQRVLQRVFNARTTIFALHRVLVIVVT
jgi:hypothetical protein